MPEETTDTLATGASGVTPALAAQGERATPEAIDGLDDALDAAIAANPSDDAPPTDLSDDVVMDDPTGGASDPTPEPTSDLQDIPLAGSERHDDSDIVKPVPTPPEETSTPEPKVEDDPLKELENIETEPAAEPKAEEGKVPDPDKESNVDDALEGFPDLDSLDLLKGEDGKNVLGVKTDEVKPPEGATPPTDISDHDEVDNIAKPKNLNARNSENWDNLRGIAKERKVQLAERDTQIAELTQRVETFEKSGGITDDIRKELEEGRQMRRAFNIQQDPEFKEAYDNKISELENNLYATFKNHGLAEDTIKQLQEEDSFNSKPFSYWKQHIIDPLLSSENPSDNKAGFFVEEALKAHANLSTGREAALQEASKSGSEYIKTRQAQIDARIDHEQDVYKTKLAEMRAKVPWANRQEIPEGATKAQVDKINSENEFYEKISTLFPKFLHPATPEERFEAASLAVLALRFQPIIQNLMAAQKHTTKQVTKLKSAGKTKNLGQNKQPASPAMTLGEQTEKALSMGIQEGLDYMMDQHGL